jgi:hypothetical protein
MADLEAITNQLWSFRRSSEVWAVVDGARKDGLARRVRFSAMDYCCLYSGRAGELLQDVAPYLVHLRRGWEFTRELVRAGWGQNWAIFFKSDARLDQLRHHFRRFLRVQNEQGQRLVFRYYDPRVLRIYLPTCTEAELRLFFGPVDAYIVEGEEPDEMIVYSLGGDELKVEVLRVAEQPVS